MNKLLIKFIDKIKSDGFLGLTHGFYRHLYSKNSVKYMLLMANTEMNRLNNFVKYDAPPNPYEKITIFPQDINERRKEFNPVHGLAQISNEGWNKPNQFSDVTNHPTIKGIYQRFQMGVEWEETAYVAFAKEKFKQQKCYMGFDNIEDFINIRCNYIEKLYYEIEQNGYSRQNISQRYYKQYKDPLEVLTVIDENGEIYLYDGHHRFAIARVQNISIPSHVLCRHQNWQKYRDELYNNRSSIPSGLLKHPDLRDIIKGSYRKQ